MQPSPDNDLNGLAPFTSCLHFPPGPHLLLTPLQPPQLPLLVVPMPNALSQLNPPLTSSPHSPLYCEFTKTLFFFNLVSTWLDYISQPSLQLRVHMWLSSGWEGCTLLPDWPIITGPQSPLSFSSPFSWMERNLRALKRAEPQDSRSVGPSRTTRKDACFTRSSHIGTSLYEK